MAQQVNTGLVLEWIRCTGLFQRLQQVQSISTDLLRQVWTDLSTYGWHLENADLTVSYAPQGTVTAIRFVHVGDGPEFTYTDDNTDIFTFDLSQDTLTITFLVNRSFDISDRITRIASSAVPRQQITKSSA